MANKQIKEFTDLPNPKDDDELLILTGLFVSNYYWQTMVAVFVAVFIPIWLNMMN